MDITDNSPRSPMDQPPPARLQTFVDIARWQAERIGDTTAFTFLSPGDGQVEPIDYRTLDQRIRAVAAVLSESGHRGQRVLIVQQPGIEYITSLFACMYAGMVAVPVYPLDVFRLRHTLPRLQAITRDADAPIMLTSGSAVGGGPTGGELSAEPRAKTGPLWELCRQAVIFTDQVDSAMATGYRGVSTSGNDLAILQYTSGTTDKPRGVALCHRHLLANAQQIYGEYHVPDAVCVFWLPPYHDMGLVGGLLLPMFAGRHSVLMSPTSFVQQPIAWLEAISRYRGTTTASPNFGYELCLRKIGDEALQTLDLSSLRVAISGAEPIRATTMRRFSARFAACGFRSAAFTPAYGMAEATLAITGKRLEQEPIAVRFSADSLHGPEHRAVPLEPNADGSAIEIVSCGLPLDRTKIRIVDSETRLPVEGQTVGEIWVQGPSVAQSYWGRPELSFATFAAELAFDNHAASVDHSATDAPETQAFLRTGDLGFIYNGQLFVSGRLKDLIIIAGRNFFAHELEASLQSSHEAFKVDGGVAFATPFGESDEERLVIVQEVLRPKRFDHAGLIDLVRHTLAKKYDLSPAAVILVAAGSLSKTSSGKLQRSECRRQFLAGELQILSQWDAASSNVGIGSQPLDESYNGDVSISQSPTAAQSLSPIAKTLASIWCEVLEVAKAESSQHFLDLGGHSLAATSLLSRIREQIGVEIDFDTLFQAPRFGQLVAEVERLKNQVRQGNGVSAKNLVADDPVLANTPLPLSATQNRFWLLDQLDWRQAFLYVETTFTLHGVVDLEKLSSIIRDLPQSHDALRLRFDADDSAQPYQYLVDHCQIDPVTYDLRTPCHVDPVLTAQRVEGICSNLTHSKFNLQTGPLFRAALIRVADDQTVVAFAAHHIVCDGSSLAILVKTIADRYNASGNAQTQAIHSFVQSLVPGRLSSRSDQTELGTTNSGVVYWEHRLQNAPQDSQLALPENPTTTGMQSRAVPNASTVCSTRLPAEIIALLHQRCRSWGVTPFEVILTAWHSTLMRYSENDDFVLGVPVAGRDRTELESVVGCFINTLPIRLNRFVDESFASVVAKVSDLWRSDLRNANVPLDAIIQKLAPVRQVDRLPLIQHLLLHQPPISHSLRFGNALCKDFTSAYSTLGAYDTTLICQWHNETASESQTLKSQLSACDLSLAFSPSKIDHASASFLLEGFVQLLSDAVREPETQVSNLSSTGSGQRAVIQQACKAERFHDGHDTILDLFADRVKRSPDQVVIVDSNGAMTFDQLDQQSSQLAFALQSQGVIPGSIVAIRLNRSRRITTAALAVWKAGAAYLPLDPSYPPQRLSDILEDAAPHCTIDDSFFDSLLSEPAGPTNRYQLPSISGADLAYLIYTSGSTGKPKGVMIGHDNLSNVLQSFASGFGLADGQRILASTTMSFDISILELFLPLVIGATSVIAPRSLSEDPDQVLQWLASHQVDVIQATPSSLRMMLTAGWNPRAGQTVWCGGEPMQIDLATSLIESGVSLWNVYGPTETTVWSLASKIANPATEPISLGRPIDSTTIRIVDSRGHDCPVGIGGELWIGGRGVGRGYWNRTELTDERFVDTRSHGRMYRTGDVVRLRSDGIIEFLGRTDRQVKIRGHRVELGEIESALNRCVEVAEAAVALIDAGADDRRLVAFYRPNEPQNAIARASLASNDLSSRLRDHLAVALPAHMIPSVMVPLAAIPHTPAGKIDYKSLPLESCLTSLMLKSDVSGAENEVVLPRTETESTLAEIWHEIFGNRNISIHDHFFHLGGHSLMAAQAFARIRVRLGVQLPLKEIYVHPTIAGLAARIDLVNSGQSRQDFQSTEKSYDHGNDPNSLTAFINRKTKPSESANRAADPSEVEPLSPAEKRLWFVDQLEPNHPFYNLPLAAMVEGPLDTDRFWKSVDACIQRHETLRSTYHVIDGTPIRQVHETVHVIRESFDLRQYENASEILASEITAHSRRPFDLSKGPLIRVVHWQLGDLQHAILVVMHHIVSDGWSMSVMMRELTEVYSSSIDSSEPQLAPLTLSYRDYAAWQHEVLTPARIEPTLGFWKQQLDGGTETLNLPVDFPRPAEQNFEGSTRPIRLAGELSARIARLAEHLNVTPFSVLLSAYGLLLSRLSGQRDLNIGTAVANRSEPVLEDLIGFFVNTVVVRQQSEGNESFAQWIQKVHSVASEAIDHQDVPFEQVVASLATARDRSHSPLFQAAFVLQNTPDALIAADGLRIVPIAVDNGTSKYDLTMFLTEMGGMFAGHFEYRSSLFLPETIDQFISSFILLLERGIDSAESELHLESDTDSHSDVTGIPSIDDLPILSPDSQSEILTRNLITINDRSWTNATVQELFVDSTRRNPNAVAIRHGSRELTYLQLDQWVQRIACGLQLRGVSHGDRVLVYMSRSIDQVASLLAVARCGAAFVPVDTQFPMGRVLQISADLEPKAWIVDESVYSDCLTVKPQGLVCIRPGDLPGDLDSSSEHQWKTVDVSPSDLAYLIYTSGSTGTPKGVAIEHRSLCNFSQGFRQAIDLQSDMRCAYLFSPSFDGAMGDIFPPLLAGAAIEVVDQDVAVDPSRLARFLTERDVAVVALTPATLTMLEPSAIPHVKRLLSAGAALTGELAARWISSHQLFNGYGPTECTVGVSIHRLGEGDLPIPSVGRPMPNTRTYVLDSQRRPVPDGVVGEIYISGAGVGRGYWRRDDLTQKSFMTDPFITPATGGHPARMYRTGDLGRWNRSHNLEVLGRCDEQIKLRGFRIEPNEISSVLDRLPGVRQSAVIAWGDDDSKGASVDHKTVITGAGKRLVAYVVADLDHNGSAAVEQVSTKLAPAGSDVRSSQSFVDHNAENEHVENWRNLFDQAQQNSVVVFEPQDDFSGWSSVITGRPIPTDEMRSWANAAASRIKRLKPKRVLEIGCGTGLILLRIENAIESYHGVDVLQSAIDSLSSTLKSRPELDAKVTLDCRTADNLDDLPAVSYDTIILNSVVQYFPSEEYFIRVLQAAQRLLVPGGRIFLGDLRNLRLHRVFAIAAELQRCGDESISVQEFKSRVRNRVEHDEELLVDPDLMSNLASSLDRLRGVTNELKTAIGDNELNRFRFDATLWFDKPPKESAEPNCVTVCNANVHREVIIDRLLENADGSLPLAGILADADSMVLNAYKPSTIRVSAIDAGWDVRIDWHRDSLDAMQISANHSDATHGGDQVDTDTLRRQLGLVEHEFGVFERSLSSRRFANQPLHRRRLIQLNHHLKSELQKRLPAYMIPSSFVFVDKLPLTVQGKLDRSALPAPPSQRQAFESAIVPARTSTQKALVQIWEELLEVSPIGIDDDFFELGGHSMLAVRMVSAVQQHTGKTLPLSALFRKPTIEQLSELLDNPQVTESSLLVPLSVGGPAEPMFCIHPAGGTVFCYRELASHFAGQRSVLGVQARGLDGRDAPHQTLQEMATAYADAISAANPQGPVNLVGWSLGGNIAYEVARQLRSVGRTIGMLALLDSGMLADQDSISEDDFLPLIAALFPGQQHESLEELRQKQPGEQLAYFIQQAAKAGLVPDDESLVGPHIFDVFQANIKAVHDYQPAELPCRMLLIRPADQIRTSALFDDQCLGWSKMVTSIELATVSGDHAHMLQQPAVSEIASQLKLYLSKNAMEATDVGIYPSVTNLAIDADGGCLMDTNATSLPMNNQS